MKKILIFVTATLFITLTVKGQDLFLIGEHSYPSTKTFTLKSNSDEPYIDDLNVVFAKDGKLALLGVNTKTNDVLIRGKLIIYLNDGTVISLADKGYYSYVDKIAAAVYYLTNEELSKIKTSNINTVRYTLEREDGFKSPFAGTFSASNKGPSNIDFTAIVSGFFKE